MLRSRREALIGFLEGKGLALNRGSLVSPWGTISGAHWFALFHHEKSLFSVLALRSGTGLVPGYDEG
jgi:hypothetical protein